MLQDDEIVHKLSHKSILQMAHMQRNSTHDEIIYGICANILSLQIVNVILFWNSFGRFQSAQNLYMVLCISSSIISCVHTLCDVSYILYSVNICRIGLCAYTLKVTDAKFIYGIVSKLCHFRSNQSKCLSFYILCANCTFERKPTLKFFYYSGPKTERKE